jgi:hypothetical protein
LRRHRRWREAGNAAMRLKAKQTKAHSPAAAATTQRELAKPARLDDADHWLTVHLRKR